MKGLRGFVAEMKGKFSTFGPAAFKPSSAAALRKLQLRILQCHSISCRGVVPGGAGGAMAPQILKDLLNLFQPNGGRLCLPNNTGTPGFSDLPTALSCCAEK